MTYKEARVYLDEMSKYGSVLGLGTIQKLLCELKNPQDYLKFIHIAGTNGKGSVLAYTSTILSRAGYRVGRYLSPTVVSYLERIQVDGQWIPEDAFARLTSLIRKAIARMEAAGETLPTVFEIETAMAFLYFKEQGCDLVVLESNHDIEMLRNGPYPYHLKRRILSDRGHLSNAACAGFLPELLKSGVRRYMLAHLSDTNNTPRLALETSLSVLVQAGFVRDVDFILQVAAPENTESKTVIF